MQRKWKTPVIVSEKVTALQKELGINPLFCELLVQRGISDYNQARRFFRPKLEHLYDPFLMQNMDNAVQRLTQAIENNEPILLYGDYDVDGTTSVAMMYSFLEKRHKSLNFYIPDRYKEGYGISFEGIEYARKTGVSLFIAMDCGIKATAQVAQANTAGIDVIICDHHLPDETLPDALAILNPKRPDCQYPFKELSGCGVAFKFIQAYCQKHKLPSSEYEQLLDFVAISIACDIVPIVDENRVLTYWGIKQLNQTGRPGIKALIQESKRQIPLSVSDIVFGLGPMINASGRLADANKAVRLMLAKNENAAMEYAKVLAHRNTLRKEYDKRISVEAKTAFQSDPDWEYCRSIVLFQKHWHKGVIGIVASRMVEAFYRPTIILTENDGVMVGSARSVKGFDIHEALKLCGDLLINYGGHQFAAGLRLRPENFFSFKDRFEAVVQTYIESDQLEPEITISAELNLTEINSKFWNILKQFAPFGPGNRNPVFVSRSVVDAGYSRILKMEHLRLSLVQNGSSVLQGIAFGMGKFGENVATKQPFDICYTIQENHWQGRSNLQLMVKDLKFNQK